ncbi:MAG: oxidoreductase [Chromatiales bacterium]|nr:oxidoreductase [Chromatiales bacterium]
MSSDHFRALILHRDEHGKTRHTLQDLSRSDLPDGDVLIKIAYSSLNYKDGLAVTGAGPVVRHWPMVPGIDMAGEVVESQNETYRPGDRVVLTGWGLGELHWGGYSQYQRVRSDWLVPLPEGLSYRDAMGIGTAGFTAMLCVMALEDGGLTPAAQHPILVTGASGGVGSVAVALLAKLGFRVIAVTGSLSSHAYLRTLGAGDIVSREEMAREPRPLEKQRWSGAIDAVGGTMLARVLAETDYGGTVAACGLAGDSSLPTSVMPFILRNIRLQGIDSVACPTPRRALAWQRLATDLPREHLESMIEVYPLDDVPRLSRAILRGEIRGRAVIDVNG